MGRYYASVRHTMQLDQDIYFAELDSEMRRGAKRARARASAGIGCRCRGSTEIEVASAAA